MTRVSVLAAAALAAHAAAQPPPVAPTYTAFPDLKAPPFPPSRDAKEKYPDRHARLRVAADAPLGPDAPAAARVRAAQLRAGLDGLVRTAAVRMMPLRDFPPPNELQELTRLANDVYGSAAAGAADRVVRRGLIEEWVRVLKELERQTEMRVPNIDPPHDLSYIRFHRLGAEAELLAAE
jgi:hypothetical protein